MPFLLMVFLVLVCLPEPQTWLEPRWTDSPWACLAATSLAVMAACLHAWWVAWHTGRRLEKEPANRGRVLARYERARLHQQIVLFAFYILALVGLGWGWSVSQLWRGSGGLWPGAELLILSPFVLAQLLSWASYYDVERASHQSALRLLSTEAHAGAWLELERMRGGVPAPFGSRVLYVLFQLRQKLALALLPVLLLLATKELQRLFPQVAQEWPKLVNLLGILAVLMVFMVLPWIVRFILGFTPLPEGALRRRLEASARCLRFRCSNILVWNTRNGMANAMVIGVLPWVRYVVFTDRLLEDFSTEEIEAVFGHEIGHVRHYHMLYYFSFFIASVIVLGWMITDLVAYFKGPEWFDLSTNSSECVASVALVACLLAYVFVVFGFLSRRCERQADIYGCRAVSCPSPNCCGHEEEEDLPGRGQGLCPTGITIFIRALDKVAAVNGINRDRPGFLHSWQHGSIGRRIEFLQRMLLDPSVEPGFQRRVFLFKALLLLILGGSVAFILVHDWNSTSGAEQPRSQIATEEHR